MKDTKKEALKKYANGGIGRVNDANSMNSIYKETYPKNKARNRFRRLRENILRREE